MIKIINNKQEFQNFYFYWNDGKCNPPKYPTHYPCVCKQEDVDGGLVGDHVEHYVTYFPSINVTPNEAFLLGLDADWQYLC